MRFNANATAGVSYHQELLQAQFCLTAPGMGFGVRLIDYVAAGCVPVVVRPGGLALPFEPDLDYDAFAVSVPFRELRTLPDTLAAMSDAAIRAKRERLRAVHRAFLWDEGYGRAYEMTKAMLLRRLNASAPPAAAATAAARASGDTLSDE